MSPHCEQWTHRGPKYKHNREEVAWEPLLPMGQLQVGVLRALLRGPSCPLSSDLALASRWLEPKSCSPGERLRGWEEFGWEQDGTMVPWSFL
jgi:hypothetical protein